MKIEVKKNAKRNIMAGTVNKIVLLLLPFFVRKIVFTTLGADYLGLNSLFNSILQVLSLSELGFSSALVYNMYKPIAENDHTKINALLSLYRKAFKIIGLVILGGGLILIPLLPVLINGNTPPNINIYIVYIIQLINSAMSYFLFAYRQSLLVAYQREDINYLINLIVQAGLQISQIVILLITHNYYAYIICLPVFTVINNIWIALMTKKLYPFISPNGNLDQETLSSIKKLITGTFIQKACNITRNSLDSICLSTFVGLSITAIYSNYFTIFNGITMVLGILCTSITGGIGNHVALKTVSENFDELKKLDFLYMTISGWCTVCLLCLFNPFMKLWMGETMLFPMSLVVLLCFYFYMLKIGDMRSIYSGANGLWWHHRFRSIGETISNTVLNIILGYRFGVYGIVIATIISLFICNFLWGSTIVFRMYFKEKRIRTYYLYHLKYAVITFAICAITYFASSIIHVDNVLFNFIARCIICIVIPLPMYYLVNYKNKTFRESIELLKK